MKRDGVSLGRPLKALHVARDGRAHAIRVVPYESPDGQQTLCAELWESHDRARRARIVPLSDLVHLIQNISADEFRAICKRRKPRE